jgi:hypothetical protein
MNEEMKRNSKDVSKTGESAIPEENLKTVAGDKILFINAQIHGASKRRCRSEAGCSNCGSHEFKSLVVIDYYAAAVECANCGMDNTIDLSKLSWE